MALLSRIRLIAKLWRELVEQGEPPRHAAALVREVMQRVPWETDELVRLAVEADAWSARQLAADVGAAARVRPDVQAAVLGATQTEVQVAPPPVVRRDAADSITINGTTFHGYRKERAVVLVDIAKLEAGYRGAPEGYQAPGLHDQQALKYGDLLDANVPAQMLRMTDPGDWKQGYKLAALRDRGYKVVPVEVPPGERKAVEAAYGAPAPAQTAIRAQAGARVIDARSWAEGIIGRGRNIERGLLTDVDAIVETGLRRGIDTPALGRMVSAVTGQAERRARFTARDQLASLNAKITREKHEQLGFEYYRWTTSRDERVRPEHRALNGKILSWDKPHPTEGHPGDAYGCRCVAVPVTVDEVIEQRRAARLPRAVAAAAGVTGLGIASYLVARRIRPVRPVVVTPVRPLQPLQPAGPLMPVQPLRPLDLPEPANLPIRQPRFGENALQFTASARRRVSLLNRSLFDFAHRVTKTLRQGEKAAGERVSHYAATFQLAVKAIRESKTNTELRERLAKLVGWGRVTPLPRKPARLPGPVEAAPKKKSGS